MRWEDFSGFDDEGEGDEFDLGIPERFDAGYPDELSELPRTCAECGQTFQLQEKERGAGGATHPLNDLCLDCLGRLFAEWAAEAEETQQIAKRLGFSLEEFLGLLGSLVNRRTRLRVRNRR